MRRLALFPYAHALAWAASACGAHAATAPAAGAVLPAARVIDWSQSGVPGGIPSRTTVCASIAAGATGPAIQAALDSCKPGQVVLLAAGTYEIDGGLTIPSHVVLRGAGPRRTILRAHGSGEGFIRFGPGTTPSVEDSVAITAGATAQSTRITLADASDIEVGSHLMVTQLNDPSYVTVATSNGTCTWCDGGIGWNGTRAQGQIVEVTAIDGKVVTIAPALYVTYARKPLATEIDMGATDAGVEDLQVFMNDTGFTANFLMEGVSNSWIRDVESNYTDGDHVQLHWSYRDEIRDGWFHDAFTHSPGRTDADIFIADKSTGTLVENNVLRRLHQSVMLNWGAAGNVVAYNYIDGNFDAVGRTTLFGGLDVHGAHPMFNLWEGNVAPKLDADYFWGSSSHNTAFRNWFKGAAMVHGPFTGREPEQVTGAWASHSLSAVDLSQTARFYSLVGNVIGSDRQKSLGRWTPMIVARQPRFYYAADNSYGYVFGYANPSDSGGDPGDNDQAYATAIVHGDYDYVKGTFTWNSSIASHALPSSFYRATKPAWFGNLAWPAFGPSPAAPATALVGDIPAKACFDQGKMPNCL